MDRTKDDITATKYRGKWILHWR